MLNQLRTFFDHSRHSLTVRDVDARLDVLTFQGTEGLSQPFNYRVEFTCLDGDIDAEKMLGQDASFSLHNAPHNLPFLGLNAPKVKPLRTLHGVVTGFKRLSGSVDEARYEITLEPRLALLGRGQQFRIYQHQSVPDIVESILRSRHDFEGQDFLFSLVREYPKREQVMQYGESDLAFISRLLADVGIWYRFTRDERLNIDVVEFHDDQRHYQFDVELPYRPQSGTSSSGQDSVWTLQSSHQVVEQHVNIRAYYHRVANAQLNGDIDQSRGASTTYGEAYHYAEPYTGLGDPYAHDEDLQSESGYFYARLRHERYLNGQTHLSGISSSATLAPGQVLKVSGGAPQAFGPGAVITQLTTRAARDRSFEVSFEAIPYSETVCFRPALQNKPQIAGTVPARVTSPQEHDPYGHIDIEGRYKVNFLFDRDTWKPGEESLWLRLARPYAGDTHGLHLPLIPGTEVAIAFEQGDPDRPYIAHALHDSQHVDHVTLRNYKRNVLRTPANNKLRMPGLELLHWSDGSPFADETTRDWITQHVSGNRAQQWLPAPKAVLTTGDAEILSLEAEALAQADSDGVEVALAWLAARPSVHSGRQRWLLRLLMARVAEQYGKSDLAVHLLGDLDATAQLHALATWEPELNFEVKARLLKLLRLKAQRNDADKPTLARRTEALLAALVAIDPVRAAVLCG